MKNTDNLKIEVQSTFQRCNCPQCHSRQLSKFLQMQLPKIYWKMELSLSNYKQKKRNEQDKNNIQEQKIDCINHITEMQTGIMSDIDVWQCIFLMYECKKFNHKGIAFERIVISIVHNSTTYFYMLNELNRLEYLRSPHRLSLNYNITFLYDCLRQCKFVLEQSRFLEMPAEKQLFENQLCIVAQYFAPTVSYSTITTWLNEVQEEVLSRLKHRYPAHRVSTMSTLEMDDMLSFWRENYISDHFWIEDEISPIMSMIEEYVFGELNIEEFSEFEKCISVMKSSLSDLPIESIQHILGCFRRYALYAVYQSVSRRLGIRCGMVTANNVIAIFWKQTYDRKKDGFRSGSYFYLRDEPNLVYPANIVKRRYNDEKMHLTNMKLTLQMMRKYTAQENNCDKDCIINFNIHCGFLKHYFRNNIRGLTIQLEFNNILRPIQDTSDVAISRYLRTRNRGTDTGPEIKFAVGMIVAHEHKVYCRRDNCIRPIKYERHLGVIIGWHYMCRHMFINRYGNRYLFPYLSRRGDNYYHKCVCGFISNEMKQIEVDQPHYTILNNDNKICYVQQDRIFLHQGCQIKNMEVGRYFDRFSDTHYVPNSILANCYPEDNAAISKILCLRKRKTENS